MDRVVVRQTPQLNLRRLDHDDCDALFAVYGDADAMRWVGDGEPLDRAGCERWVEVTLDNYARRGYGMFAMELRATGEVAGFCGIVHPNGQPEPEIKYALRREYWHRGLATEAVRGLVGHAFGDLGLEAVIATVAPENAASCRVLEKAGLTEIAPRTNPDGTWDRMFRRRV